MVYFPEITQALNLTQALKIVKPAFIKGGEEGRVPGQLHPVGGGQLIKIKQPPTAEELKALAGFAQINLTLGSIPGKREVSLVCANEKAAITFGMCNNINVRNFPGLDEGEFPIPLNGFIDDFSYVFGLGVVRVRNLTEKDGPPVYHKNYLEIKGYRRGMEEPFIRQVDVGSVITDDKALYGAILEAIIGRGRELVGSFAVLGLPRVSSRMTAAELYFINWQDFRELFSAFGADYFTVFHPDQSWVEFFIVQKT